LATGCCHISKGAETDFLRQFVAEIPWGHHLLILNKLWDYVIVHELLHFFVPNHGKLWKSLVRA
jgi:predicted nuclease of restriction endonuclease-like (RecB) superfamily